ncbi:YdcF family protein [Dyella sp. M7H15-1]|uniref:YdcF family protein n=1 Tax=Dyella sp. M7H15-1 TaxID=2501295 RepID=UPI001004E32D|nr:YdcF family protein [Dyella sp. M7H15-1]QAU25080.1 YdcF family protein [Dyella sp. M7H15-1]
MLTVLLVLCLLGLVFGRLCGRRCQWTFFCLTLLLFFTAGCGPLPALLLKWLQAPYAKRPTITWAQHNAIVLLGAGTTHVVGTSQVEPTIFANGRIIEAYALYRACRQGGNDCKIVVSGGDPFRNGITEAVAYGEVLTSMGVASDDLLLEIRSMNTWQNAQFVQPMLKDYRPEQVLLVSSAIHLNRALLFFAHFGIDAIPVRGDYTDVRMTWRPNAWNLALTDFALHEYNGMLTYRFYSLMGWNAPPSRNGNAELP